MWPNPQFSEDLVTFTEEILNEKLPFCVVRITHGNYTSSHYGVMNDNNISNANLMNDTVYKFVKKIVRMDLMMWSCNEL